MSQSLRTFLRKCQILLSIAFGTVPVGLILFAFTAPELVPFAWVFPGAYLLFSLLALALRGKRRLPYGITVSLLMLLLTGLLTPAQQLPYALILSGFYGITLLWSLRLGSWTLEEELPVFWGCFCVIAHLAGQLVLFANRNLNNPVLEPSAPWMLVSFFVFAVLAMLSMNRASLADAAGKRQAISNRMRQKNVLLTLGLFLAALLICLVPAAAKAIQTLASWIFTALQTLFFLLMGRPGGYAPGDAVSQPMDTSTTEQISQGSELAWLINLITLAIGAILTLLLALYLLRSLYRKLKALLPRLLAAMGRFAADTAEDYEDEITDTREQDASVRARRRRKNRLTRTDPRTLTPGQRIRARYQHLSKKHPAWTSSSTARENLPAELAPLYERARYSQHPITEEEASRFTSGTKRI